VETGWTTGVLFLQQADVFSLHCKDLTGPDIQPASYLVSKKRVLPSGRKKKQPDREDIRLLHLVRRTRLSVKTLLTSYTSYIAA
jgi:hypothetical protein